MKIVSWNCNGRFREKIDNILSCNADIYVIQESENPEKYRQSFRNKLYEYEWYGLNDSKGVLVFGNDKVHISNNNWENCGLRHFLSLKINNSFDLIAVWASPPYIEEYYVYQQLYRSQYKRNTIIIGDFNSNSIWDKDHRERNHSAVVSQLSEIGLYSAYHFVFNELQGEETRNTFYLQRNLKKGYHIDYCFINPQRIASFELLDRDKWLKLSDHIPLCIEIS